MYFIYVFDKCLYLSSLQNILQNTESISEKENFINNAEQTLINAVDNNER